MVLASTKTNIPNKQRNKLENINPNGVVEVNEFIEFEMLEIARYCLN